MKKFIKSNISYKSINSIYYADTDSLVEKFYYTDFGKLYCPKCGDFSLMSIDAVYKPVNKTGVMYLPYTSSSTIGYVGKASFAQSLEYYCPLCVSTRDLTQDSDFSIVRVSSILESANSEVHWVLTEPILDGFKLTVKGNKVFYDVGLSEVTTIGDEVLYNKGTPLISSAKIIVRVPFDFSLSFNLTTGLTKFDFYIGKNKFDKTSYSCDNILLNILSQKPYDSWSLDAELLLLSRVFSSQSVIDFYTSLHMSLQERYFSVKNPKDFVSNSSFISSDYSYTLNSAPMITYTSGDINGDTVDYEYEDYVITTGSTGIGGTSYSDYTTLTLNSNLSHETSSKDIYEMALYIFMPFYTPKIVRDFITKSYITKGTELLIPDEILSLRNSSNIVKTLCDFIGISPTKPLSKALFEDISKVFKLPHILSYFKDYNNVFRLLKNGGVCGLASSSIMLEDFKNGTYKFDSPFLDYLFSKYPETIVCNKIVKHLDLLDDSSYMYSNLCKLESEENKCLLDRDKLKGSLEDMHDYLSYVLDKIETPDIDFISTVYSPNDPNLNTHSSDFVFKLVGSLYELKDLGRDLENCVGTYSKKIIERRCNIFRIIKSHKNVCCIELSGDFKRLVQARTLHNGYPSEELIALIHSWINNFGITLDCRDIPPYLSREILKPEVVEFCEQNI